MGKENQKRRLDRKKSRFGKIPFLGSNFVEIYAYYY
jgi:hypothetical protein